MDSASPHLRGVNDPVPAGELGLVATQHAVLILAFLVYPLAAAQPLGLSELHTTQFITACIVSVGVATMLHVARFNLSLFIEELSMLLRPHWSGGGNFEFVTEYAATSRKLTICIDIPHQLAQELSSPGEDHHLPVQLIRHVCTQLTHTSRDTMTRLTAEIRTTTH